MTAGFVVDAEVVEDLHRGLLPAVGLDEPARADKWPGGSPALPWGLAGRGGVVLGLIFSVFDELIFGGGLQGRV